MCVCVCGFYEDIFWLYKYFNKYYIAPFLRRLAPLTVLVLADAVSRVGPRNKVASHLARLHNSVMQVPVLSARGIIIGPKTCAVL